MFYETENELVNLDWMNVFVWEDIEFVLVSPDTHTHTHIYFRFQLYTLTQNDVLNDTIQCDVEKQKRN